PRPSIGFELARELGIVKRDEPELNALIDCPQEAEWHPEGDVWIHTMMVLDEAAKIIRQDVRGFTDDEKLQVMLGALCHDLGKPATTAVVDGRTRSLGHEEAGEEPTKALCTQWTFSQDDVAAAVAVAREHLKPAMFAMAYEKGQMNDASYVNAVRRLLKRIHPTSWKVLIAASEADSRGRAVPGADTDPYTPGERFARAIRTNRLDEAPTKPLIQGRDLLNLGFTPGPEIGRRIKLVEEARDRGEVRTRDEALELISGQM
ncbi:MAG TPA: HD domain-containing protein, partial [Candidatus Methylomirabilis sp.]|nr:HD domain-containing protein [Candidatus Methylomirabilis sp.]